MRYPCAMIMFSVGPFGPLAAWCDAAIACIVEAGLGPVVVMGGDTPDDVATNLIRSTSPHLVEAASRRPSEQLRRLLAEAGGSLIIAFDAPVRALHELMVGQGNDMQAATRIVADSSAAALVCAGFPGAAVITAQLPATDPAAAAETIARCCELPATRIALSPLPDDAAEVDAWWATFSIPMSARSPRVRSARMRDGCGGDGLGQIVWDRSGCSAGRTTRQAHAGVAIDIGDALAPLVSGPWIGLPPGNWAASVTIAVSKETNGTAFDIAIYGGDESTLLARASIVPDGRGLGSATLLFTVAPASGQTISFVIANTAPAPGGRLAMGNVVLTPSPAEGSGVPAELTTALGL